MRIAPLALVALPSLAAAGPITAGVTVGQTQADAEMTASPHETLGLFGRFGLGPRVAGQLEVQRIETSTSYDVRNATGLLVLDLGSNPQFVPALALGIGLDRATLGDNGETDAHHFEAGFGLEYRSEGGLVLGVDGRIGTRTIDSDNMVYPGVLPLVARAMPDGQYRSLRLLLGVRF